MTTPGIAAEPPRLGALEAQVMDALWDHGPGTIRDIINRLSHDPAYTTIATVLRNLDGKKLVTALRQGHSTRYEARIPRGEHVASVMRHALESSRDRTASMLHFIDTIPPTDLDLLRNYLRARTDGADGGWR